MAMYRKAQNSGREKLGKLNIIHQCLPSRIHISDLAVNKNFDVATYWHGAAEVPSTSSNYFKMPACFARFSDRVAVTGVNLASKR